MQISKQEILIKPTKSELALHTAIISPENPTSTLQITHGMNEHKERYFPFMKFLAERGIACIATDSRGHGKSVKKAEDLGYLYENPAENLVNDIKSVHEFIRANIPNIPHFHFGHSMGSLSVRLFAMEHDNEIDGLILSGCPCYARFIGFADRFETELEKKLGSDYRNENLYKFGEAFLNRNFGKPPHSWICSDEKVVEDFNNDPLCNFIYTLSGYEALFALMRNVYNQELWSLHKRKNVNLPIHLVSGKNDPCMFSEEKFFEARRFLEKNGFKNVTHKLYMDMRHEILNEKNKQLVWNDILEKLALWTKQEQKG